MKRCSRCGLLQAHSEFYRRRRSVDGLQAWCRSCLRTVAAEWEAAHPGAKARRSREARKRNPEAAAAAKRKWELAHPEKVRAQQRRMRERHAERAAATVAAWRAQRPGYAATVARRWRERNPDRAAELARRGRERRRVGRTVEGDAWAAIVRGDPCSYCGGQFEEFDHIDPVSRGGSSHWSNITSACKRCNMAKRAKPLLQFLLVEVR